MILKSKKTKSQILASYENLLKSRGDFVALPNNGEKIDYRKIREKSTANMPTSVSILNSLIY